MAIAIVIRELQQYLIGQGIGLNARNLRLGRLPASESNQLVSSLRDTGSIRNSHTVVDRTGPLGTITGHYADRSVQVLTRSARYEQGLQVQELIYLVLHGRHHFALGAALFCQGCEALEKPQIVQEGDDADQGIPFLWATNYTLLLRDLSSVA